MSSRSVSFVAPGGLGRIGRSVACYLGGLAAAVAAQTPNPIQINEINFTTNGAADAWIEIANFGTAAADVGSWSVYQATHTPNLPAAYWWPIPPGTRIPAGGFLRIRWLHAIDVGNTNPLLIDTGDTSYHFLFSLRGEPLARAGGALALVASKNSDDMGTASFYRDFVAWGADATPYAREDLAAANGRWVVAARALAAFPDQSVALISNDLTEPTQANSFYRDTSPTPGRANHADESAAAFGNPCVIGLGQPAQLSFRSIPTHGNADFRVVVDNLVGGQTSLALAIGLPDDQGTPWLPPCNIYVDLARPTLILAFSPATDTFFYRPPYDSEVGKTLGLQAVGLRPNATFLTAGGRVRLRAQ